MKISSGIACIQVIFLIGLACSVAGCIDDGSTSEDKKVILVTNRGDNELPDTISHNNEESVDEESDTLAGSCPFGRHCCGGTPYCALFTDANSDGCCDMGVQK
ncbi:hypothetical protein [Methanocalculus sp.]|uniref:hypothetical protein n=1 Tax=Methanocalculus sp. TaxID=2004547 RepID=UPI00271DBCC1|nr:hypothetical protein [Methanocalculus sp.]MDO8842416.1 hypothetical protein [Methanocalculus sp.]